jgi:DNA-binding transcriptional MerR regulator
VLRIGDFSRLARVTVKTLRFYDDADLFHPAHIDPRSGYRFYRADQLPALQRIRLLRELGCSIAEIRKLTMLPMDSADYAHQLKLLRKRVMVRLARDEQRLRLLDRMWRSSKAADGTGNLSRITERCIAPVSALTVRDQVRSFGPEVERMFEQTEQRVARHGCRAALSPFVLLHDMEYRDLHVDVEVCVPVEPDSVVACGGRIVEGIDRAACVHFAGSYDQAPPLYELMLAWMEGAGMRIAGPIRETYLRFGAHQGGYTLPPHVLAGSDQEYETELQVPITNA